MIAVPPSAIGKHGEGTAFAHNSDGWDRHRIEWVVPDASRAQVYGVIVCYFHKRPVLEGNLLGPLPFVPAEPQFANDPIVANLHGMVKKASIVVRALDRAW